MTKSKFNVYRIDRDCVSGDFKTLILKNASYEDANRLYKRKEVLTTRFVSYKMEIALTKKARSCANMDRAKQ